jgi:dipeptidyl aminopeptidase/acylaminoacyl peptidase
MRLPLRLALVLAMSPALARAASPVVHPTPEEVASIRGASDLSISPDGSRLVYALSVNTFDPAVKPSEQDADAGWKRDRQIWVVDLGHGEPRQLTRGAEKAGAPVWSPDGREVVFLRKVKGKSALHVIAVDGGEATVVATGGLEPAAVRWSPDGRSLAFLARPETPQAKRDEKWRDGGTVDYDHEWESDALWIVPRAGGEPKRVSRGGENVVDYAWSPDGARFVVLTSPSGDPYQVSSLITPRLISATDGVELRTLDPEAREFDQPRWSPDGKRVAFLTTRQSLSMTNVLEVCDLAAGRTWNAAPSLDLEMSGFVWSADSQSLIALVRERTGTRIERFPAEGGPGVDAGFAGRVADAPLSLDRAGRRLAFVSSTDREPRDPTVFDLEGRNWSLAARLNPEVERWSLGREEAVRWKSENGIEIEGLLLVSPAAKPGAPAPLIVFPHGGPDDVSASSFGSLSQFFAAHGFSVFRPNYRGSFGYGREFYAANRGRFGGIEFRDIESGVDALVAAGKADEKRLFYGGWSWGGYITAWTIGHTHRYRAAVVGAGVNDVAAQYALSDINHGVAAQWEYEGDPWRQLGNFDRSNPIRFVKNVTTPTLIFHGQSDPRVAPQESIMLYRALSDLGVPTRLYEYPREPHNPTEPAHQVHRMKAWLDWYARYLSGPGRPSGVAAR